MSFWFASGKSYFFEAETAPACTRCGKTRDTVSKYGSVRVFCRNCGRVCLECYGAAVLRDELCADCRRAGVAS